MNKCSDASALYLHIASQNCLIRKYDEKDWQNHSRGSVPTAWYMYPLTRKDSRRGYKEDEGKWRQDVFMYIHPVQIPSGWNALSLDICRQSSRTISLEKRSLEDPPYQALTRVSLSAIGKQLTLHRANMKPSTTRPC